MAGEFEYLLPPLHVLGAKAGEIVRTLVDDLKICLISPGLSSISVVLRLSEKRVPKSKIATLP